MSFSPFENTQDLLAYGSITKNLPETFVLTHPTMDIGTQSGLTILQRNATNSSLPYSKVAFFPTNSSIVDIAFARQSRKDDTHNYQLVYVYKFILPFLRTIIFTGLLFLRIATCAQDNNIRIHTFNKDTQNTNILPKTHTGPINTITWTYLETTGDNTKVDNLGNGNDVFTTDCIASVSGTCPLHYFESLRKHILIIWYPL